ncbi:MAG: hypothetical protein Q7U12_00945 [Undibacterium sp.]|nr:hypothetical protein [Undibacterium sp.]
MNLNIGRKIMQKRQFIQAISAATLGLAYAPLFAQSIKEPQKFSLQGIDVYGK